MTWECSGVCLSHGTEQPKEWYPKALEYLYGMSGPQGGLAIEDALLSSAVSDFFVAVIQQLILQEKPIPYGNRPILPIKPIMGCNSCR